MTGVILAFRWDFRRKEAPGEAISKEQIEKEETEDVSFFAMDTIINMEVYGGEEAAALKAAETLLGRLEGKWSVTDPGSEVYGLNHSHGTAQPVSEETQTLISFALETAKETGGAFNPLLYPVVKAWGFTTREYRIPEEEELEKLLAHTDYGDVILEERTVALKEGIYWHILDPEDGYPADSGLISATIVGKEGKLCDALSTAVFVMGWQQAEDYWRNHENFEMILITSDNEIYVTEGIEENFFLNEMSRGIPVHVIKS